MKPFRNTFTLVFLALQFSFSVTYAASLSTTEMKKLHPSLQALVLEKAPGFHGAQFTDPGIRQFEPSGFSEPALPLHESQGIQSIGALSSRFRAEPLDRAASAALPVDQASVFVYTRNPQELRNAGIQVQSVFDGFVTARVHTADLETLARIPSVTWIDPGSLNTIQTDVSVPETGARLLQGGFLANTPYKGKGVIVLIYDTGIDWKHMDFRDPTNPTRTRILSIWDQTISPQGGESSPSGLGYGVEYTKAQIDAELASPSGSIREQDINGHGTHVAGIAAGNGLTFGGKYAGMAPEADIVVVKGGNGSFGETNMVDGLTYASNIAARYGVPVVVNWSIGGQSGPHDGTRAYEVAVDNFVASPGHVVCISAGNDGANLLHKSGTIAAGRSATIYITVPSYTANAGPDNDSYIIDTWLRSNGLVDATVISPGGVTYTRAADESGTGPSAVDGTIDLYNYISSMNAHRNIQLYVHDQGGAPTPRIGTWQLVLTNRSGSSDENYDLWIPLRRVGVTAVTVVGADNDKSISMPATAAGAITVASYVTKWSWPSYVGQYIYNGTDRTGSISTFSSLGPTADGRQKPDLAAPGQGIVSALSATADTTGDYSAVYIGQKHWLLQGTSMAAPHVTGAAALLLGADASLTAAQIKTLLTSSAYTDIFTSVSPNYTWGSGKLDVLLAMARLNNPGAQEIRTIVAYDSAGSNQIINLAGTGSSGNYQKLAVRFTAPASGQVTAFQVNVTTSNNNPISGTGNVVCEIRAAGAGTPGALIGSAVQSPIGMLNPGTLNYIQTSAGGVSVSNGSDYYAVLSLSNASDLVKLRADMASAGNRSWYFDGTNWVAASYNLRLRIIVTSPGNVPPSTGELVVTVHDGENWAPPGTNARVHLYANDGHLVGTQQCNTGSMATFADVPAGSGYYYTVDFSVGGTGALVNSLYWGKKSGITITAGQTLSEGFTRNMPYAPTITVFDDKTNENVAGKTVQLGTLLRVEVQAKNPSYAGAGSQTVKARLTLDTNRVTPLEADYWSAAETLTPGTSATVAFYHLAQAPGHFYQAGALTVPVDGVETYTECFSDYNQPFFTVVAPPAVPTLASPANGATGQPLSLLLRWNKAAYAGKYRLQTSTENQFLTPMLDDSSLTDTLRAISGLTNSRTYYWRVRASNAYGASAWSVVRSFTTEPRPAFMVVSDSTFAVGAPSGHVFTRVTNAGEVQLTWSTKDNAAWLTSSTRGADTIEIDYQANITLAPRTGTVTVTSNATNSPLTLTLTQAGAAPKPQLSVWPTVLQTPWTTSTMAFTVKNMGTGTLSWSALSNQSWAHIDSGAAGRDSGRVVLQIAANTTSFQRTAIITVTADSAIGSPAQVAVVQDSCPPAGLVSLIYPKGGEVLTTDTVRLLWQKPGSSVTGYLLEALADSLDLCANDSTLTDTTYTLRGLERGRSYLWRVKAKNPAGWGLFCSWGRFSRLVALPLAVELLSPQDFAAASGDSMHFVWRKGFPAVDRYWLEMALDSSFSFRFMDSTLTDTSFIRRSLQKGVTYFWHVKAANAAGWGAFSPVWHFALTTTGLAGRNLGPASRFALEQNYPNPFNPSTTIRFSIPRGCRVQLVVYNALGQEVAALVDGEVSPGMHEVSFDGAGLPSGLYFYRLRAGTYVQIRKLALVR